MDEEQEREPCAGDCRPCVLGLTGGREYHKRQLAVERIDDDDDDCMKHTVERCSFGG